MEPEILKTITSPADLKRLDASQLKRLASEIRAEMIATTSLNGGHLASSLGVVEIVLALHRVLDCPHDRIVFDVGHQAYAHKLVTGRYERFYTLRSFGGISGFPKIEESPYDVHDSGHASDSLSAALGMAIARDLDGGDENVVALIGDGAISSGLAMEAMNQIGQHHARMLIVLNDNSMSISKNVGAVAQYLTELRVSSHYINLSENITRQLSEADTKLSRALLNAGKSAKDSLKRTVIAPGMLFEDFGIKYLGPVDGHDEKSLEQVFSAALQIDGPVLIHAVTRKGAGYRPAELHPDLFHGIGPFDISTGQVIKTPGAPSYTKVFSQSLIAEAKADPDIVAITAAMPSGTGLDAFHDAYPQRFFDVGICEEHAVVFASGLASRGKVPVVAIYSTFLQRSLDEIITNVALPNRHVVFCLDRAGLVGADGPTHHGAFDLAYLRFIPNMKVLAPSSADELVSALHTALALDGPVAIRYPRGAADGEPTHEPQMLEPARSRLVRDGSDVCLLALGRMVGVAEGVSDLLAQRGVSSRVVDMRWLKPLDLQAVREAASLPLVATLEDGVASGGLASAVSEVIACEGLHVEFMSFSLPDEFVEQGTVSELFDSLGLSPDAVAARILERLGVDFADDGLASSPRDES
jgi:1-deoxy-D-xylulose-5-phosphate synthase